MKTETEARRDFVVLDPPRAGGHDPHRKLADIGPKEIAYFLVIIDASAGIGKFKQNAAQAADSAPSTDTKYIPWIFSTFSTDL